MSYDVRLEDGEGKVIGDLDANYTYNVGHMFKKACGTSPLDWDGLEAWVVAARCQTIIDALEGDVAGYDAMNPENKWGSREGAVEFVRRIRDACQQHPTSIVRTS